MNDRAGICAWLIEKAERLESEARDCRIKAAALAGDADQVDIEREVAELRDAFIKRYRGALSTAEAAYEIGVEESTLRKWENPEIAPYQVGRCWKYDPTVVARFIVISRKSRKNCSFAGFPVSTDKRRRT